MAVDGSRYFYAYIDELKLWKDNFNQGDVGEIVTSIERFGFKGALGVWKDGTVYKGNHSLMALMALKARGPGDLPWPPKNVEVDADGRWAVLCMDLSDLDQQEVIAFAVADNKTAQDAVWDERQLATLLVSIQQERPDLVTPAGFGDNQLDELLQDLGDVVPGFEPVSEDEQPRLDQKKPAVCPNCGHEFTP